MLHIAVYKVIHGGETQDAAEQEARKLIPYVMKSDVFSVEMAAHSSEEARQIAHSWSSLLQNPRANRSNVQDTIKDTFSRSGGSHENAYWLKVFDYLFRNKVGLWLAEQYPTREQGRSMNYALRQITADWRIGLGAIQRNIPGAVAALYEMDKRWAAITEERDRIIQSTATSAENGIRDAYPWLAQKPVIRWGIPLGSFHEPEQYIPGAQAIPLATLPEHVERCRELREHTKKGSSLEDVTRLILEIERTARAD